MSTRLLSTSLYEHASTEYVSWALWRTALVERSSTDPSRDGSGLFDGMDFQSHCVSSPSTSKELVEMKRFKPEESTYEIERVVGEGLSAVVYKAFRVDSRRLSRQPVALKILKSETAVSDLRREFETLSRVVSPHCVRVLAWENLAEGFALVLEWVEGVTLFDLARDEGLSDQEANEVLSQALLGLAGLRLVGLHHGDLNPKNILVDRDGLVRLVDFASRPTSNGQIHGSPAYLAPEIWAGGPSNYEADLFALGLIITDACDGFKSAPRAIEEAQSRLQSLDGRKFFGAQDLLSRDPGQRCSPQLGTTEPSVRARIASRVVQRLRQRAEQALTTAVIPEARVEASVQNNRKSDLNSVTRRVRASRSAASVAALLVVAASAVGIPVRAGAPFDSFPRQFQQRSQQQVSRLDIRSHQWLEVAVNGVALGYAPIRLRSILAGSHRISWRGPKMAGEARVRLAPGETLLLNDADLLRLANLKPVTHQKTGQN